MFKLSEFQSLTVSNIKSLKHVQTFKLSSCTCSNFKTFNLSNFDAPQYSSAYPGGEFPPSLRFQKGSPEANFESYFTGLPAFRGVGDGASKGVFYGL